MDQNFLHREWLGLLQPVGLVVAASALEQAQAVPDRNVIGWQSALRDLGEGAPSLASLLGEVLEWAEDDLLTTPQVLARYALPMPEYGLIVAPDGVVPDAGGPGEDGEVRALLLVQERVGVDIDASLPDGPKGWQASVQERFERLLRERGVAAGLLWTGDALRLVYAPAGESSGHLTFPLPLMREVAGRPVLSALRMLLSSHAVFGGSPDRRLLAILANSRKAQSKVSTALSEQVLDGLNHLLRGFQAADSVRSGDLLRGLLSCDDGAQRLYEALLTVLMRLIFLLYAEERGLMSADALYMKHYAVGGLYEKLRDDAGRYPDTMDQRFGAWPWLLSLFRMVFFGRASLGLPPRHSALFDPSRHPILEGRAWDDLRQEPISSLGSLPHAPRVSDGVVFEILDRLLMLDGERLSYRALDVEHIGSVYEALMGFEVRRADGPSLGLKPARVVIDLSALLRVPAKDRKRHLADIADCKLPAASSKLLASAKTLAECGEALTKVAASAPLPPGTLYLQPTAERRRTGSHYTPRALTEPVVRHALAPIIAALGPSPTPHQILSLNVCDPAMGSGAFLVEACRQLADHLLRARALHPSNSDATLEASAADAPDLLTAARRRVAQRCIYGVDRNHLAVELARLSLWLVTLDRTLPLTFLDHALKHGDSLVGLISHTQAAALSWQPIPRLTRLGDAATAADAPLPGSDTFTFALLRDAILSSAHLRAEIPALDDHHEDDKRHALDEADARVSLARLIADIPIRCFFAHAKDKDRLAAAAAWQAKLFTLSPLSAPALKDALNTSLPQLPAPAFHWEIEFPEVFLRDNPGFDAFIGNPPFAGKNTIAESAPPAFLDWLKTTHDESHGNADLVSHFFRRTFTLLRDGGTLGLIATNTISQGDTRHTGLRWICTHGGTIYRATRRYAWPGLAAVIVSVVHIAKGPAPEPCILDGRFVPQVTAYLFHAGIHENPATLKANAGKSFQGPIALGMGFTFDDTDTKDKTSSLSDMHRLIAQDPRNHERIFPYIGGEEVNSSPTHAHHRYIISFGTMSEEEARDWPDLMAIVEDRVKPERMKQKDEGAKNHWWQFIRTRPELYANIQGMARVLVHAFTSQYVQFAFVSTDLIVAGPHNVFPLPQYTSFAVLQSQVHEIWARFFASSMKDDMRYTPSDCFETFPFPRGWEESRVLEEIGERYYNYRAALMVTNDEGMTKTYNRFHDSGEVMEGIQQLRALHGEMDRAVLSAYGWGDLQAQCEFVSDNDEDEDNTEEGGRRRGKSTRYRWPDEVRDEVLARLLALNAERAHQEAQSALAFDSPTPPIKGKGGRRKKDAAQTPLPLIESGS